MPKKFFRRYLPAPRELRQSRQLRFALGDLLHDANLWHLNRRSVSGGFAVGLFVAWIPLPIQMISAGLLALLFRVNLPLAVVLVWITNPLTMGPMYWFAWWLGAALLGHEHVPRQFEFTFDWFGAEIAQIWQPLFLGCALLAVASSAAGYLICRLFWRYQVIRALLARRRRPGRGEPSRPR
jgi:uncharacterized protein (DUF2062 family)